MEIRVCKECGFILGARPNSKDSGGVCLACLNKDKKKGINWIERQKWLTRYIKERSNHECKWDVVVGVSGGKDSTTIVRRLIEEHEVPCDRVLLVHVCDEFTPSEAGMHNLNNLVKRCNVDMLSYRMAPGEFVKRAREDFFSDLNPLKWIEAEIYNKPFEIAKAFHIPFLFMGENSDFEYGESEECDVFHPASDEETKVIYMGAIWPYSTQDFLERAKEIGFKTLNEFDDWCRQGCGDDFSQIDSKGYMVHLYLKFIKFGFQRVSDMSCRFVREGVISKEQAERRIRDFDWICDPMAKKDFCRSLSISEKEFKETIDRFANREILVKDEDGNWRRKDLI